MARSLRTVAAAVLPLSAKHAVRRVLRRPSGNARRYLPRGRSIDDFLTALTERQVRYAVLRWFETLPEVEPGGDIDLLVADADLPAVESLLTPYRPYADAQKIDLYTAGGLPRTRFGGAAYLARPLAEGLLERAELLKGRYRVPAPQDHFDSLAYHAVHHKGAVSGLPAEPDDTMGAPGGKIPAALQRLATRLGLDVELTLGGLRRYLEARGYAADEAATTRYAAERARLYGHP